MTIKTYVEVLHDGPTSTDEGQPVLCPFQPDGLPKPVIDHDGVIYRLNDTQNAPGMFDYQKAPAQRH